MSSSSRDREQPVPRRVPPAENGDPSAAASARRLATAIVADIRLFNEQAIREGRGLADEIDEGRALFAARVRPEFHAIFDEVVAESLPEACRRRRPAVRSPI